jgi:hypothetical protein
MGFTHFTGVDAGQLKIDGTLLTVTAAELNAMSGGGLSAAELGYLDDAVAGTQAADKVVIPDTNVNIGITKVTELHVGASGSEIQVLASQPAAIADYTITWTANTPTPGDTNTIDDGATVGDDNEGGQAIADLTAKVNAILAALRTTGIIAT